MSPIIKNLPNQLTVSRIQPVLGKDLPRLIPHIIKSLLYIRYILRVYFPVTVCMSGILIKVIGTDPQKMDHLL